MAPSSWRVASAIGDAGEFHQRDPEPVRSATFHDVSRPTLVLGSAQIAEAVDQRVADALGVEVVRRRSGGGAVLLVPGEFLWLDLVIPAGDSLWHDDVSAAMWWVGDVWRAALADVGVMGAVHTGGLQGSRWSRQVCWASVGAGEVMHVAPHGGAVAGKLVGVSQRRTRGWARFQSMVHLRWRPEWVAALAAPPRPTAAELGHLAVTLPRPLAEGSHLRAALEDHLPA